MAPALCGGGHVFLCAKVSSARRQAVLHLFLVKANRQLLLPLDLPAEGGKLARGLRERAGRGGAAYQEDRRILPSLEDVRHKGQVLADGLRRRLGHEVKVLVTDNRSSLVTARWDDRTGRYVFRVHHMFLDAETETMDALSDFGSGSRKKTAGRVLDSFIARNRDRIRKDPASGPRAPSPPKGRHHDLQAIFDGINEEYFDGKVAARIGWGRGRGEKRRRRSIKMGSYVHDARLIRVHPALDRPEVPGYYVAWVVFHEMLHQVVPPVKRNGRTYFHPVEFRTLEQSYRHADEAQAWEDRNFDLLLRG